MSNSVSASEEGITDHFIVNLLSSLNDCRYSAYTPLGFCVTGLIELFWVGSGFQEENLWG